MASGSADNTIMLWDVKTGKSLKVWKFPTAVKRVEFNEDNSLLLGVTEQRMGHIGSLVVFSIINDVDAERKTLEYFFQIFKFLQKLMNLYIQYLHKIPKPLLQDGLI